MNANGLRGEIVSSAISAFLEDDLLPLQPGPLEVQDHPSFQTGDLQIVEHLPNVLSNDLFDALDLDDQTLIDFEIGDVVIYLFPSIQNWICPLLVKENALMTKLDAERPFIRLLPQPMSELIQYSHGASHDPMCQLALDIFASIRVHARFPSTRTRSRGTSTPDLQIQCRTVLRLSLFLLVYSQKSGDPGSHPGISRRAD